MLPHWFNTLRLKTALRDELRISVEPRRLVMLRVKRGSGNAVIDRQVIEFEPAVLPASAEALNPVAARAAFQDSWRPSVAALRTALRDPRGQDASPRVVLSSHFVRYAIIPWNAELANAAERDAYLRHCFVLAYGEVARQWDLRLSPAGFGQAALASGISTALLEAIRIEFEQAGMKAGNVHPHLMPALNETWKYLGKAQTGKSFWFVSIEPGRLCLGLMENGQWRLFRSHATEADISGQLQALIQRESIMTGIDTSHWPVIVHWSETESPGQIHLPGHTVSIVPGPAAPALSTGIGSLAAQARMSNRIALNHAAAGRSENPLVYAFLLAGVIAGIALMITVQNLHQQNAALVRDINRLQQPGSASRESNGADSTGRQEEIAAVRSVMADLSLPWEPLFRTLEKLNDTGDIRLIALEPNPRQHKLRITAESADTGIMLLYVEKLGRQSIFKDVFLLTHEQTGNSPMPVRFVVEAAWQS